MNYFKKLFNNPAGTKNTEVITFSGGEEPIWEVEEVINRMKNGKASEKDGITMKWQNREGKIT